MIEFCAVDKSFRDGSGSEVRALDGFEVVVEAGETHCLIGTSGCGKTTALRLTNRLETADRGDVRIGGESVLAQDPITLRRRIGYVIQSGGLFPHMTVEANVGVLGSLEGWSADALGARVDELLELVGLPASDYGARYPGELSGGQRQRVGVARALALDPAYLLLDEPFGALDPITRRRVHADLAPVFESMAKTVLLVTHDLDEAFLLADRISIMDRGRVVQTGTAKDLVDCPVNEFVAEFVAPARGRRDGA